jgi:hypothetical protein
LVEDFAETVVTGVKEIADPPRAGALTPEGKTKRSLPFFDGRSAVNADSARFEVESTQLEGGLHSNSKTWPVEPAPDRQGCRRAR